jgi:putative transposase
MQGENTQARVACAAPMAFYRRNLPHWIPEARALFITWRLYGSLPSGSLLRARAARSGSATGSAAAAQNGSGTFAGRDFVTIDRYLDSARTGPRWLAEREIAGAVEEAIFRGVEFGHYLLDVYVIMPNHVHILLRPLVSLARITGEIKGVSAKSANARLGRTGNRLWQDESFDHWVRNSTELERVKRYIEWNPAKAGLVTRPELWRWSSAYPEMATRIAELARPTVSWQVSTAPPC